MTPLAGNQVFPISLNSFSRQEAEETETPKAEKGAIMKPKWKSPWRKPIRERVELFKLIKKNSELAPSLAQKTSNNYA